MSTDGYEDFFKYLTTWENKMIDKCYQESDYKEMMDAPEKAKQSGEI